MSTARDKESTMEPTHLKAAKRLVEEVVRDYSKLMEHGDQLCGIVKEWKELMTLFRSVEQKAMIEKEPSEDQRAAHLRCINAMILCAETIANACERHLEINFHLEDGMRSELQSEIELIKRHRVILAFEFTGWAPMDKALAKKGERDLFGESGRKAA